jgi:hypothetical protein
MHFLKSTCGQLIVRTGLKKNIHSKQQNSALKKKKKKDPNVTQLPSTANNRLANRRAFLLIS